jgi:hypothetical protein
MNFFNNMHSSESPGLSLPTTPNSFDASFDARLHALDDQHKHPLPSYL